MHFAICDWLVPKNKGRGLYQNAISANLKTEVAMPMPMPSSEIIFWKRALNKHVHIYTHIYICEKLLSKTQSMNLALALQAHDLEWRLAHFAKELFKIIFQRKQLKWIGHLLVPEPFNSSSHWTYTWIHKFTYSIETVVIIADFSFYCVYFQVVLRPPCKKAARICTGSRPASSQHNKGPDTSVPSHLYRHTCTVTPVPTCLYRTACTVISVPTCLYRNICTDIPVSAHLYRNPCTETHAGTLVSTHLYLHT